MRRLLFFFLILIISCTAINKANKLYDQGDYTSAIKECQAIIAGDSLNASAHYILGKCYRMQGEFKNAIASLVTAYHITPHSAVTNKAKKELIATRIQYGDTLVKQQKKALALEEYQTAYGLDTTSIACLFKLADLYFDNGFYEKAALHYQKILQREPENKVASEKIAQIKERENQAKIVFQKGKRNFEKYRYQTAIKYLKKALRFKPDYIDAQYYLALARGSLLYKKGRKSNLWDAIEEFGKAASLKPESGVPHFYMALAYEKKDRNEFDNAIQEYKIALQKEPNANFARKCRKKIKELTELRDRLKKFWGK